MEHPVIKNVIKQLITVAGLAIVLLTVQVRMNGQAAEGAGRGAPPASAAKENAPFDPAGYWVSMITENWRLRMVPPAHGDYVGVPISVAGKKIADAWDMAKDEAAGNQCKYYGAGVIMYLPERLHITWQDGNTLRMDVDSGSQTRQFHFGSWTAGQGPRTWQGNSVAIWESRRIPGGRGAPASSARYLKVTTDHMLAGYLRRNGVPYSENASLTEYYDLFPEPNGAAMMIVTAIITDPTYLDVPYIMVSQFKRQANESGWNPTPCSARW